MKKHIYLMPRRSGKSTLAEYEFNKDIDNSMFICYSRNMMNHLQSYKINPKKFFTSKDNFAGIKANNAIIDEYLLFDIKGMKNVYEALPLIGIQNLYIFASAYNYIDKNYVDFIKLCKSKNVIWNSNEGINLMPNKIKFLYGQKDKGVFDDLEYLYFNFITDVDANVTYKLSNYSQNEHNLLQEVFV